MRQHRNVVMDRLRARNSLAEALKPSELAQLLDDYWACLVERAWESGKQVVKGRVTLQVRHRKARPTTLAGAAGAVTTTPARSVLVARLHPSAKHGWPTTAPKRWKP